MRADEAQVCGYLVTRFEQNNVAGHEVFPGNAASLAVTNRFGAGASMWRIASMAFSALPSCKKPITALASTTAKMTPVSTQCPKTP